MSNSIGKMDNLQNLNTANKSSYVDAINEISNKVDNKQPTLPEGEPNTYLCYTNGELSWGTLESGAGSVVRVVCNILQVGHYIEFAMEGVETFLAVVDDSLVLEFSISLLGTLTVTDVEVGRSLKVDIPYYSLYTLQFPTVSLFDVNDWVASAGMTATYDSLSELLEDEKAVRKLMIMHDSIEYLGTSIITQEDRETIFSNDYCAKWVNANDYALDTLSSVRAFKDIMLSTDKYFHGEWGILDDGTFSNWGVLKLGAKCIAYKPTVSSSLQATYLTDERSTGSYINNLEGAKTLESVEVIEGYYGGYLLLRFSDYVELEKLTIVNPLVSPVNAIKAFKIQVPPESVSSYVVSNPSRTAVGNTEWVDVTPIIYRDNDKNVPGLADTITLPRFSKYSMIYRIVILETFSSATDVYINELRFYGRESTTDPFVSPAPTWTLSDSVPHPFVTYDYGYPVRLRYFTISKLYTGVDTFNLYGKNSDDTEYTLIKSNIVLSLTNYVYNYNITVSEAYSTYKIECQGTTNTESKVGITAFQFYGYDYSEHLEREYICDRGIEFYDLDISTHQVEGLSSVYNTGSEIMLKCLVPSYPLDRDLGFVTSDTIDLTDFSKLSWKFGSLGIYLTGNTSIYCKVNPTYTRSNSPTAYQRVYDKSLDLSNVSGDYLVMVTDMTSNNNYKFSPSISIKSLWLE